MTCGQASQVATWEIPLWSWLSLPDSLDRTASVDLAVVRPWRPLDDTHHDILPVSDLAVCAGGRRTEHSQFSPPRAVDPPARNKHLASFAPILPRAQRTHVHPQEIQPPRRPLPRTPDRLLAYPWPRMGHAFSALPPDRDLTGVHVPCLDCLWCWDWWEQRPTEDVSDYPERIWRRARPRRR